MVGIILFSLCIAVVNSAEKRDCHLSLVFSSAFRICEFAEKRDGASQKSALKHLLAAVKFKDNVLSDRVSWVAHSMRFSRCIENHAILPYAFTKRFNLAI